MTLGFDASTSTVGFSFYNGIDVVDAGFIDISKLETNKEKSFYIIEELEKNENISFIKKVNLEAALFGFMGGKTSQQTIIKLARFNAVFEYIISERWAVPVNLISVMTARKKVLGKARVKGMTGKEYVSQQINTRFPQFHKFDKMNKKGMPDIRNEDVYDAIIISLA